MFGWDIFPMKISKPGLFKLPTREVRILEQEKILGTLEL
jgi:hypothetical protein